jgi:hypothetical protein
MRDLGVDGGLSAIGRSICTSLDGISRSTVFLERTASWHRRSNRPCGSVVGANCGTLSRRSVPASQEQVHGLAQGVLTGHLRTHAAVNIVHTIAGTIVTWGLLMPAVFLGAFAWTRNTTARSMTIFLTPGLAFFLLYYFSDGPYLAYTAAAGMVLAGVYIATRSPTTQRAIYVIAVCVSLLFMISARPADGSPSTLRAVTDAYFVRYSIPSLKEQRDPRLAKLLGACHDSTVQGVCK